MGTIKDKIILAPETNVKNEEEIVGPIKDIVISAERINVNEEIVTKSKTYRNITESREKVAIVTGASAGIGAAIVKALLELGMRVVGVARRKEKVEKLGKGYEKRLFAFKADVTKEQDILDTFKWTEENVGELHVLVNNAGISDPSSLDETDSVVLKNTINTNFVALTLFTREAIKVMKANEVDGTIININSVAGHYPVSAVSGISIYQGTKFAVTGFTESVRLELAKEKSKIRITSLSPGMVETAMTANNPRNLPCLSCQDVAKAVKYIVVQPQSVNIAELIIRPTGESI